MLPIRGAEVYRHVESAALLTDCQRGCAGLQDSRGARSLNWNLPRRKLDHLRSRQHVRAEQPPHRPPRRSAACSAVSVPRARRLSGSSFGRLCLLLRMLSARASLRLLSNSASLSSSRNSPSGSLRNFVFLKTSEYRYSGSKVNDPGWRIVKRNGSA